MGRHVMSSKAQTACFLSRLVLCLGSILEAQLGLFSLLDHLKDSKTNFMSQPVNLKAKARSKMLSTHNLTDRFKSSGCLPRSWVHLWSHEVQPDRNFLEKDLLRLMEDFTAHCLF